MASSMKRDQPMDEDNWPPMEPKRSKIVAEHRSEPSPFPIHRVVLNPADCDLDFDIEGDGLLGSALYKDGFAYCWSGARANVGIYGGKYCFGCKIIAPQLVDMDEVPLDQQNLCQVGISRGDDAVGKLGETRYSFGFCGPGKFSNAGRFLDYGEQFVVGDTIICCVDLECEPMASIGFCKNGKWLGIAMQFDPGPCGLGVVNCPFKRPNWESGVFPHILLKNVVVQMQFSVEDGLAPPDGYKPWSSAIVDSKEILGPSFQNLSDCEVIMMVGLHASGKSTWAENLVESFPEKRYILLCKNFVLDHMKVPRPICNYYHGKQFDHLVSLATKIYNTLLYRASKIHRNFIIDQINMQKNARKHKLRLFTSYRKIAVVVFPTLEELKNRANKRVQETGKTIPDDSVNEKLVSYTLPMSKDMPNTDEYFDEVYFPELSQAESESALDLMKKDFTLVRAIYRNVGKSLVQCYDSSSSNTSSEASIPSCRASLPNMTGRCTSMTTFHYNSQYLYASDQPPQGPQPELFAARPPILGYATAEPNGPYRTPISRPGIGTFLHKDHLGGNGTQYPS